MLLGWENKGFHYVPLVLWGSNKASWDGIHLTQTLKKKTLDVFLYLSLA